ncbi:MAG: HD domain-containing protein [Candidatus Nealsonbacteria bacterium]|nr:HD domain-containing protein [Candidatus Nealsonbacteria bacterium]
MDAARLEKVLESGDKICLGNLFEYLQGIAEGLESVVRWEYREKIAGQSVRENDLQHSYKTALLTLICAIEENQYRAAEDRLDLGLLCAMALIHDISEIFEGDLFGPIKGSAERNMEMLAFEHIVSPLPRGVRKYFLYAFRQAVLGTALSINSAESRFFNAIEKIGAVKRSLHECRLGNTHFAPKCLETEIPALQKYAIEFPSLRTLYGPYIDETIEYVNEFREQRNRYLADFVRNGGNENDFLL